MRLWPLPSELIKDGKATITGTDAKHIATVLRKKAGDSLVITDSKSTVYNAVIDEIDKESIALSITGEVEGSLLKKPDVTLALSISKAAVMELVVQKAVELGCNNFIPLVTAHSVTGSISENKLNRMEKIAHEAYKQSGRAVPMSISRPLTIAKLPSSDLNIVLWEEEKQETLQSALSSIDNPESLTIVIGPMGGINASEIEELKNKNFKPAGLGKLILRAETAALAILSIANYHFGRMI